MTFDHDQKPVIHASAPVEIAAALRRDFYARRPLGLSVQFEREDGIRREYSWAYPENRDIFLAKLKRIGTPYVLSA